MARKNKTERPQTPAAPPPAAAEEPNTAKMGSATAAHLLSGEKTGEDDRIVGPSIENQKPVTTGTAVVTVALKHPNGVYLEVFAEAITHEPVMGGGTRESKVHRPVAGTRVKLNGNRVPVVEGVLQLPNYRIVGGVGTGYALTAGVPRDIWQTWLKQHHDSPLVQNNLIQAFESQSEIEAFASALDNVKQRSGLEALRRNNEPRAPKRKKRDGTSEDTVSVADEQSAREAS